ncbi:MAG TPA: sigma-70 family RNA polymerase sigma factor [Tepidisphaeraceae bacterium]|jgi:RNA polymerase sigma-70 factor (ECF subfamily)|nr:sigma-70 family RNA polymerase sigma factor [Tepidisphaeraceae bacterium]
MDEKGRQTEAAESTNELFERAVRQHSRRLLAIARAIVGHRASPEDVVQQAFMNLYQHRDRYDWREPGGLMRRTVVNEALRILRQPHMSVLPDEASDQGRSQSPSSHMIESETILHVRRAIDRLPDNFRAALVLCEYEKMSYAQIAEALDASIPQVKTWIHRGRRQLAELLRAYVDQP